MIKLTKERVGRCFAMVASISNISDLLLLFEVAGWIDSEWMCQFIDLRARYGVSD